MDTFVRDVKQSMRLLARHRGFAAVSLITIALGVGGTATIFSVVYGVLLRPLPYLEPDRLVRMWEVHPSGHAPIPGPQLSGPTYRAWSRSSASLQDIGAFRGSDFTVSSPRTAERLRGTRVTPSVFRLLRVTPAIGRFFIEADVDEGAEPVVVLAHSIWQIRFGADPSVVGTSLTIDGVVHRIVGVAPTGFAFPEKEVGLRDDRREVTLYTPFIQRPPGSDVKVIDTLEAIGRLNPGATIAQVEAEGTSYARSVDRPLADLVFGKGNPVEVRVHSLVDQMTLRVQPALMVMAAGVTLVLLAACANVATLFLSRGSDKERELSVRAALGASRSRLLGQLFTESLVIALLGGIVGILLGWAMTSAIPVLAPADFPRVDEIQVDVWFLVIAGLTAVLIGTVSGALPAFRGSRTDLTPSMQTGGARTVGTAGAGVRRILVVVEAALAVVLLIGAGLLARSFAELVRVDPGYEPDHVLTADVRMPSGAGADERGSQLASSLVERLQAMPGVRAAGAGDMAPFGSMLSSFGFALPGMTTIDGRPVMATAWRAVVTPGYAEALGMRLREGRFFSPDDIASAIRPILVNETFARTYFADGRAVTGRRFKGLFPRWLGQETVVEIIGIVDDMLPAALDAPAQSQIFVVHGAKAHIGRITLVVKTDGDPIAAAPLLRNVVQQIEPGATIERMAPLTAKLSASVGEPRFATSVLIAFAILALVLAATGVYGVLSYDIAQRGREIAVRAALGATRGELVAMVMRDGVTMTLIGLTAGVPLAMIATHAMASTLFGVTPLDAVAFAAGPLLLVAVACAACLIPARRAVAIDPAEALRVE